MLGRSRGIPPEKFWKFKYSWMQSSVIYMLKYFANARIPYWTKNNGRISNKMLQQAVVVVQKVITLCWLQTYSVQNEPENLVEFKEIRKLWSSVFFGAKFTNYSFYTNGHISVSKACRLHCMFPLHIIDFVLGCKSLVFIFISGKPTVLYTYWLHFSSQPWKGGISNDWLITNISWLPGKCKIPVRV